MQEPVTLPKWAWLIVAGVLLYVWTQDRFPTRVEEELKHKAAEERILILTKASNDRDKDLENKIGRLADLVSEHVKQPNHSGTAQSLAEHNIRLGSLEEHQRKVVDRLDTNENLLREIKARLETKPLR